MTLVADKLLQVEMKHDRNIEGENHERENNRSGLGGKNPIVGAFVTAGAHYLMYNRYLSKLHYDQLLYTDTDSVIVYHDQSNEHHLALPMSDLLGDIKNEYGEVLATNPSWYMSEFIAFGPKMYQLLFKDRMTGKVVRWEKTMKGMSLKGNVEMFPVDKISLCCNPVIDFCSNLQFGNPSSFSSMLAVREKMLEFKRRCKNCKEHGSMTVNVSLNQTVFKRNLSNVFTDNFVMSQPMTKRIQVTQFE